MDNHHNHLLEQQTQKKKHAALRRLICTLVLVVGIAATSLTFTAEPALAQSATSMGPDAITPCHNTSSGISRNFEDVSFFIAALPNTQPVGDLEIQLWYCASYQSTFARFIYTAYDTSGTNYTPQLQGTCSIDAVNGSGLKNGCDNGLRTGIPVDTGVVYGPNNIWTAEWDSSEGNPDSCLDPTTQTCKTPQAQP